MPYAHRTEFPEQYAQPWNEPRYEMPDGSGPWTIIAYAQTDEPAGRYGERGVDRRVQVTDAPHHRRDDYHDKKTAESIARMYTTMVEQYDASDADPKEVSAISEMTVNGFVDGFDVVLRRDAERVN